VKFGTVELVNVERFAYQLNYINFRIYFNGWSNFVREYEVSVTTVSDVDLSVYTANQ